jgi:tRNA(fMet)-specific endonuclease VapC
MYLLDTNHCSYIIDNIPNIIAAVQSRSASDISISIITYGELLYMTEKLERQAENLAAVRAFLMEVDLYFIDEETAIFYSQIKAAVFKKFGPKDKSKRRSINVGDLGFDE